MKRWIATTEPKQQGEFRALQAKHLEYWRIGARSLEEARGPWFCAGCFGCQEITALKL
jgi:hypothetical protein